MRTIYKSDCCTINTNEIDELILLYRRETGKSPNYLMVSNDTYRLINRNACLVVGKVTGYHGINIAICDNLKFGEVEAI